MWTKMILNPTASSLADGKELRGAVQNEGLLQAVGSSDKEVILGKDASCYCKVTFL